MDEECLKIVAHLWNHNSPRASLGQKLRRCGAGLNKWSSRKFKRSFVEIQDLSKQLKTLQDEENQENIGDIIRLQ